MTIGPVPTELLPEYVEICSWCSGTGQTRQTYTAGCGGGYYRANGPCERCSAPGQYAGIGLVFKSTGAPVGASVVEQIKTAMKAL